MSRKLTVHLSEKAVEVIGDDVSASFRINQICDRYQAFVSENTPSLTTAEWFNACLERRGFQDIHLSRSVNRLIVDIAQWFDANGAGAFEKPTPSRPFSIAQRASISEVAGRFWRCADRGELSPVEWLEECGAKIGTQHFEASKDRSCQFGDKLPLS